MTSPLSAVQDTCGRLAGGVISARNLDGRPNEIAHRIAAEADFKFLLERGVVDASCRPENQTTVALEQTVRAARRMLAPVALAE